MISTTSTPCYLLAGGRSQRFDGDKAREQIDGQSQLVRLKLILEELGHLVFVVADDRVRFADLDIKCLEDLKANCGPLAGLGAALQHRLDHFGEGWLLLCNCDQLKWQINHFLQLAEQANNEVCFSGFCGEGERIEPMPALYHTSLQDTVRKQLAGEDLGLQSLLRRAFELGFSLAKVKGELPSAQSFNTREELHKLLKRARE